METSIHSILKQYWGYDQFRPLQEDIIQAVLAGRDTLALMPTGGGKSICFQVPALAQEGICIVISPLIALMKDQVEQLRKRNIPAIAIYSGMGHREIDIALDNCIFGNIKLLYLSPERLHSDLVQERIRHMKVNLFAIDEAHCISQWGYDFRPSYLKLSLLRELHPNTPLLALTASATLRVVDDIQTQLLFREQHVLKKSFARPNLGYMALEEENKMGRMLRIIHKMGGSGVIYVRNRRETQEVARFLVNHGIPADFYHAGLTMLERSQKQDAWTSNRVRAIVATNAFGMGIDKPDVRTVIHADVPDCLENYYQEAGRAGRDGKKSYAILLYQPSELEALKEQIEIRFPDLDQIKQVYQAVYNYLQVPTGAGAGEYFVFDMTRFLQNFKLDARQTLYAIQALEQDGWLTFNEQNFKPSTLGFVCDKSALYRFEEEHPNFEPLIKALLRSYEGIYDQSTAISENNLAYLLREKEEKVKQLLLQLHKAGLVEYEPKSEDPQI